MQFPPIPRFARRAAAVSGLLGVLVPLAACSARAQRAPELLLVDGKVFTADSTHPWAEAVAIRGERITRVGTTAEIRALAGPGSRVIDVGGRVIAPGFDDAHDHVHGGEDPGVFVELGTPPADPPAATVLDSLRAAAARVPAGTWIQATIFLAALNDASLRRAALDRVAPRDPVMLSMPTGHGLLLNSAAMRALGIRDSEPDPFGGWYERDASGRLTGRLDEYAGWSAIRTLRSSLPDSVIVAGLRAYARRELRFGITSVQDMASSMDAATTVRVFRAARLPLRVRIIRFSIPSATGLEAAEWVGVPEHPAPNVVVSGRKWILDGTPVEQNALTRRGYPGRPGWYGRLDFPVDSLRAMLVDALRRREQVAFHAGDSAQAILIGLMESLAPDSAWRPLRVRFEHGMAGAPDLWARAAAKGIVVVGNLQLLPPPEVSRHMPPVPAAAVVPQGLVTGLGSDGEPRSPFVGMYYALSFPLRPPLDREALVRAYTAGSAYAEFAERDKGTLAPGKLADLAVLSQDIFTVPVEALPRTESVLTLVGGRVAYDAGVLGRHAAAPER
ncbi:MAG TPA: amidohydrolase family protein [Longimicrobiales bacterium]|nr:amidohydrolase family protein [Longimicrobiales bacterium]